MGFHESEGDAGYYQQRVGEMTTAHEILQAAQQHMDDRAATYDKPEGERSMSATVEAFSAITGVRMTEEQGWLFMAVLKAVRSQQGDYHEDCYTDGAAYFALAGEAAHVDRLPDKESREDVLKNDDDTGWKPWNGKGWMGPIGLSGVTPVEVLFKDGMTADACMVKDLYWENDGSSSDIIAYRIVK